MGNPLLLFIILVFIACKNKPDINDVLPKPAQALTTIPSPRQHLPFLDTTISLSEVQNSYKSHARLSEKEAEALLYKHFKRKGVRNRRAFRNMPLDSVHILLDSIQILCVDYDTIYQIQTNKFSGAIISYWLGPVDLNGHCFQPSAAVILNTKSGYRITNEEFIPDNFAIDSTIKSNIYGFEYECGGRGVVRHFKITLK